MKGGVYFAAALIGGALLANVLLADPGYVALRFAGYLVEMSAATFLLVLLLAYGAARLVARAARARRSWREQQAERRHARARESLARGLLELAEGEWEAAEKTLVRHLRDAEHPIAHYLAAARAAELQDAPQRRDEWLRRALELPAASHAPALIMQAELHLKHKQLHSALEALEQLQARGEQNARGLLLLARIYRQTGDWQQLQDIEPRLRNTRGISAAVADETVAQIYLDRLKAAGDSADSAQLRAAWKDIPKSLAQRSDVVIAYARAAMACDEHDLAEAALRESIERHWDEGTVLLYGEVQTETPLKTLEHAQGWLDKHAEDAALLLSCARLAARAELYGKARSFLEASIAIRPRLEAYQLLASLLEQLGERERALKALDDALALALGGKANLPRVRQRRWLERRQQERRQS